MENVYVNDFTTSVKTYYKELKKCTTLTREKERELLIKAKNNDLKAKNEILKSNLKFVFDVAKKYKGYGVPIEDLISEGNIGLTKAIDKFDISHDVKFFSYAVWWIRASMQECIKKTNLKDSIECGDETTYEETLNTDIENDEFTVQQKNEVHLSNEEDEEKRELNRNQKIIIRRLLKKMDSRSRKIIEQYFGLNGYKEHTLEDIAKEMNLSKERIRQIKLKSLRLMRSEILLMEDADIIYK